MSVKLNCIAEGQTEEAFVNEVLKPHLSYMSVWVNPIVVRTGYRRNVVYRGGLKTYARAKNDITRLLKQDRNPDTRFTTMFDLYALPTDFPGYPNAVQNDPYQRVKALEDALGEDIPDRRFIPYIQLHEFEALLLSDPRKLDAQFDDRGDGISRLVEVVSQFSSPELINDGINTAPSKRIISAIPKYEGRKVSAGPLVAKNIGLSTLRSKCAHFADWLDRLESLT